MRHCLAPSIQYVVAAVAVIIDVYMLITDKVCFQINILLLSINYCKHFLGHKIIPQKRDFNDCIIVDYLNIFMISVDFL